MVETIFIEIGLVLTLAFAVTFITRLLKQPLIIGYILSGIIIGPSVLNLLKSTESFSTFSQLGVAILLFMVGLNLNPKVVKDIGPIALFTGIGQIIFTIIIGFIACKLLGFSALSSIYLATAISFSSTIIIMKILADKEDTDSLYGRISIGFLLVQDFVAIIILMVVSAMAGKADLGSLAIEKVIYGGSALSVIVLISIFILPKFTKITAKSQELLLFFSISWALAISALFAFFGFSIEIGALLAGISLSLSPFRYEISSKIKPLRDFFLLIFFIFLGSQMAISEIGSSIPSAIILSLIVIIGNPLIVMIIMGISGYTKRNSFLAGLTVSQISEFSFILIALGVSIKHLPPEVLSLTTLIGLITMGSSTYLTMYSKKIYPLLSDYLSVFERKGRKVDDGKFHEEKNYDIIMFGYNRIGFSLIDSFKRMKKKFLIVDFNPETIQELIKKGIDCHYGDAGDLELLSELPIRKAKLIVSTIPEFETNQLLIKIIKKEKSSASIIVVSHQIEDSLKLYEEGADYVVIPHFIGGAYISSLIESLGFEKENFASERIKSIQELRARKKEGHKSPVHERD